MNYAFEPIYKAAMCLLPEKMNSKAARAMVLAIGLQESRLEHRRQIGGPARGFFQFELAGIAGVLTHAASRGHILSVLKDLRYDASPHTSYVAIEHNDILACCYARLLLWTYHERLPFHDESERGWWQYQATWRPGKPIEETWPDFYRQAWGTVV
jgi:hypothetical protein